MSDGRGVENSFATDAADATSKLTCGGPQVETTAICEGGCTMGVLM